MQITIDSEEATNITVHVLLEDYADMQAQLKVVEKTKGGIGVFSREYEEERKAIRKLIKGIEVLVKWYGAPDQIKQLAKG